MKSVYSKYMKTLVTHDGVFHPDDVFAAASISLLLKHRGESLTIIRTRNEDAISSADFVSDVGGIFDASKNRFDHHQVGGAGARENGVPYASFGLVWKTYGLEICNHNQWVVDFVERRLVAGIDATDNGTAIRTKIFEDVSPYEFSDLLGTFLPSWCEDTSPEIMLKNFLELETLAERILTREIKKATDIFTAEQEVARIYETSPDKRLIVLDQYYPWKKKAESLPEALICVFPNNIVGNWIVYCVPEDFSKFTSRILLPQSWAGLQAEELAAITGVPDAVFCHRTLFMGSAKSKEGALALAHLALDAANK